jgi:hypothetical protein
MSDGPTGPIGPDALVGADIGVDVEDVVDHQLDTLDPVDAALGTFPLATGGPTAGERPISALRAATAKTCSSHSTIARLLPKLLVVLLPTLCSL